MLTTDCSEKALSFGLLTLFPQIARALTDQGVTSRAFKESLVSLTLINPRDFTSDRYGAVDDRPYGGGPGMVLRSDVMSNALSAARGKIGVDSLVVAMSPQGERINESRLAALYDARRIIFIAGRYEGIDERFIDSEVDMELSIGDIVVTGGELPALLLMDALIRRIPGALGHECSAEQDSFVDGLLDYPQYTRPKIFENRGIPAVLLSGHHGEIAEWRHAQSIRRTLDRRPDLLQMDQLTQEEREVLARWSV